MHWQQSIIFSASIGGGKIGVVKIPGKKFLCEAVRWSGPRERHSPSPEADKTEIAALVNELSSHKQNDPPTHKIIPA